MKLARESNLRTLLRWALALSLISASLTKIANLTEFLSSLAAYELPLPDALLRFTAVVLPWLELLCGILLIAGGARRAALVWSIALFTVFTVVTGQAWARGLEIGCGCFDLSFLGLDSGKGAALAQFIESVKFAFLRAVLLLAGAIYLFRAPAEGGSASAARAI